MPPTATLLAIGIPLVLAAGIFWMWMRALHHEIGPSLVATTLSIAVIVVAMGFGMKLMEPPPPEQPLAWDDE
ncbi:hypothetical protein [Reyranella sp.]|uniref:hypothetical protein n=1 Tax=Reyranella sp. TaxID=1929291 RepID=UPI001207D5C3|nr:hypothetical protein [Reyranella sp.]TAJ84686.1 MAG: hypothetical protein EPO50_18570 [Reyranella sp.]